MPLAVQQSDIELAVAEGLAPLKAIIDEVLFIHRVVNQFSLFFLSLSNQK